VCRRMGGGDDRPARGPCDRSRGRHRRSGRGDKQPTATQEARPGRSDHRHADACSPNPTAGRLIALRPADGSPVLQRPSLPARTAFAPLRAQRCARFCPQPGKRGVRSGGASDGSEAGCDDPAEQPCGTGGLTPRPADVRSRCAPIAAGDNLPGQRQQNVLATSARSMWRRRVRSTCGFMGREFSRRPQQWSRKSGQVLHGGHGELLRLSGTPWSGRSSPRRPMACPGPVRPSSGRAERDARLVPPSPVPADGGPLAGSAPAPNSASTVHSDGGDTPKTPPYGWFVTPSCGYLGS
jgi:hypothetical protein